MAVQGPGIDAGDGPSIRAIARHQRVGVGPAIKAVRPGARVERIRARPTEKRVVACTADEGVVARPAIEHGCAREACSIEGVGVGAAGELGRFDAG